MEKSKESYAWLGRIPIGIGAVIKGWDIIGQDFRNPNILPVVDFRAMTEKCPRDCPQCFTDKNKKTLSLGEIKRVICEIKELGARAIDFLGEGEPTLDIDFWEIIEFTNSIGIIPIVFTESATKLRNPDFVKRLKNSGASIIPKCDSLFNSEYQNWVVGDKTNTYFYQRNEVIDILIKNGFNDVSSDGSTRLGFDMVISSQNIYEVPKTLRFCRENNIWIIFSFYLPSGRSAKDDFNKNLYPTLEQKQEMQKLILEIDKEFGFDHPVWNNFATIGCVERLQIYGDGRVSPCPGNETIIGAVQHYSIRELHQMILDQFPSHDPTCFDGHCLYRPRI